MRAAIVAVLLSGMVASGYAEVVIITDANAARVVTVADSLIPAEVQYHQVLDAGTYTGGVRSQPVFAFQMTGIAAPANITAADFSVGQITPKANPSWSVDTYVIRTASTSDVILSDYADGQLLMSNFSVGPNKSHPSLNVAGQSTLGTWLKNHWADGEYVFIGLQTNPLDSPDTVGASNTTRHEVFRYGSSFNNGYWTADSTDARLTINVIPQPATIGLLAF